MISSVFKSILFASLVASIVIGAPAGQETTTLPPTTTTAASSSVPAAETSTAAANVTPAASQDSTTAADLSSSAPATEDFNTTSSMAVSSSHDLMVNSSSFTCYGKQIGYYADVEHSCKVYHFCLLGDYNGDSVYQRISYLCLNHTVFDQQALDCVDTVKLTAPCEKSASFYDSSNAILRETIVGNQMHQSSVETTTPKA